MKLRCVILLLVLLAVQACNEKGEPEPEPTAFLTVTLGVDHFLYDDMWVFATDATGKVLDAHPVQPGSSVTLTTLSPPEVVNLTVYYNSGGSPVNHLFYTYAGINSGEEIRLESAQPPTSFLPPVAGKATINIQNCNPYGFFNLSDGHALSQFASQSDTFIDAPLDLRQETSDILISSHKAIDEPVYGWVHNVTNGELYTIDFNNLTPFPKAISVLFSESISVLIVGWKAGVGNMGYVMANRGFSRTPAEPDLAKFGYLDGFDEYSLFVTSTNVMSTHYRSTHYSNYGASLPEEITFPDNSLTIENPFIGNFNFTYSSPYTYRDHYWRQEATDHTMHWRVYTDNATTPLITELPKEFSIKYPALSVGNLTYSKSDFYKHEDGYTYDQLLRDIFGGTASGRREFFQDSFQQK